MRLFRRKKNYSVEELNKINQERWEKEESKSNKVSIKYAENVGDFNDNIVLKEFDFTNGLESVIEISYGVPRENKIKLFFSQNDFSTFSRNYSEKISDNFVRLIIQPSARSNATLISGGNFDFNGSFEKEYSLFVSMRREDSKLLSVVSNVVRSENFGCLPSRFTITAHRNDDSPITSFAREILSRLNSKIYHAVLEMKT
jgi:hypothetical protein